MGKFPSMDEGQKFASVGTCCPDLDIRIVNEHGVEVKACEEGELQLSGRIVFTGYYKNEKANMESFVEENGVRWFKTGDKGKMVVDGGLRLTGRSKDTININGNQYFSHDIEAVIDRLEFVIRSVCISARAPNADTEQLIIFFVPAEHNTVSVPQMGTTVASECVKQFGIKCTEVVPLTDSQLPKGALGKVNRKTMETRYTADEYKIDIEKYKAACAAEKKRAMVEPSGPEEEQVRKICSRVLGCPTADISTDDDFFALGFTSLHSLAAKKFMDEEFDMDMEITQIYKYRTVAKLAASVKRKQQGEVATYDPIVPMQTTGEGIPIFFVHPGVGHVLVFTNLAKTFAGERPFYGIIAPGFEPGQPFGHESMDAMADCYAEAIVRTQAKGPYNVAGYSFGGVVAFETAKRLEHRGHDVDFLAMLNIPPHIKTRMDYLDWGKSLVNLCWFLDLVKEDDKDGFLELMETITKDPDWTTPEDCRDQAVKLIVDDRRANKTRLSELHLTSDKLRKWVDVAQANVQCGRGYQPTGTVAVLDVFFAIPVMDTMEDWKRKLADWKPFSRNDGNRQCSYTQVPGRHYTLMDDDHVEGFAVYFKYQLALREFQANHLRAGNEIPIVLSHSFP